MADIKQLRNGVIWSAIDKVSLSAIQLVLNLIIARLIIPEEYALIAMISIFIAIGQTFIESGFSQSLIHKQNRNDIDFSTVFYFNIGVALIIYLIIFAISPLIASFYNNHIFIKLTRIVALNLIISSFAIVQRAILTIKTDFKTQAIISVISIILSGFIGLYMAYTGYGVWAMVVQTLSYQTFAVVLLWILVRWYPKSGFSFESFKVLFSYGSKLLASRIINTICQNLHSIVIGKYYSRSEVAYFTNANQISLYSAGYLNDIIQRALFPRQCEIQDDIERTKNFYLKVLRLSAFIIFPIMACVITLAKPFVLTVLTNKWEGMIIYMQIIAFAYMWYPLMSSNQMFNVLGRTDLYLKNEIIKKIFFIVIVAITLFINVTAMCWGIVVYNFIEIAVTFCLLKKILPLTLKEIIIAIYYPVIISILMSIVIVCINSILPTETTQLMIGGIIGCLSYIGINVVLKTQDINDIIKILNLSI